LGALTFGVPIHTFNSDSRRREWEKPGVSIQTRIGWFPCGSELRPIATGKQSDATAIDDHVDNDPQTAKLNGIRKKE